MIALYFWSGLQKINISFVTRTWPEFVHGWPVLIGVAWLIPLVEVSIAIGLMTRRGRLPASIAAVAMHAFNIVALSRRGENYVVLPWNAAMAGLVIVLFAMHDEELCLYALFCFADA